MTPSLGSLLLAATTAALLGSTSQAQGLAAVGPVSPDHGFPLWYEDHNGLRLDACLTDQALCGLLDPPPVLVNPNLPFPDNYGGVFADHTFYNSCDASMPTNNGGQALLVITLQGAFDNADEAPIDGDQDVFARFRIRVDNLIQGQQYTVTTPVGTLDFIAENSDVRGINFTDDVGRAMPGVFGGELAGALGPFLMWDSGLPIVDASGREYVGDPGIPHTITGSPFGTNVFRIEGPSVGGPGVNMIETDLFNVIGLLGTEPVVNAPVASFSAAPTSGEAPLPVAFTDTSTGDVTAWSWSFGDGSSSSLQNPTHLYALSGTYTVSLTASGPGGSDTATSVGLIVANDPVGAPELILGLPDPGIAGRRNTMVCAGGTEGGRIRLLGSMDLGSSIFSCGGGALMTGLLDPNNIASARTIGGSASLSFRVHRRLAGEVLRFQAIDVASCTVSNVVTVQF